MCASHLAFAISTADLLWFGLIHSSRAACGVWHAWRELGVSQAGLQIRIIALIQNSDCCDSFLTWWRFLCDWYKTLYIVSKSSHNLHWNGKSAIVCSLFLCIAPLTRSDVFTENRFVYASIFCQVFLKLYESQMIATQYSNKHKNTQYILYIQCILIFFFLTIYTSLYCMCMFMCI